MTAEARTAEPFVEGLFFGECPRWHDGRLWYVDFYAGDDPSAGTVSSVGPTGDVRVELDVPGQPAGLGWLPDGRLVVVARTARTLLVRQPDGRLDLHADLTGIATFHCNDMVVAADGTAYVGNFGFDLDAVLTRGEGTPGPADLAAVAPDGTTTVAATGLEFPNGTVLTPDGGTLVVAETFASRLTAFTRRPDGSLSDRRVWAELPGVFPDGICLDAEGRVWVADALAPSCLLVAEGGAVVDRVATSRNCFACMLGGDDRRTLYLVTATSSIEAEASASPQGRLEQVRVDVPGAGLP